MAPSIYVFEGRCGILI